MKKLILAILFFVNPVQAEPLDFSEKIGIGIGLTLHGIDYLQTREVSKNDAFIEGNPFLGENPTLKDVNLYFLTTGVLYPITIRLLPKRIRDKAQYFYIGMKTAAVLYNYRVGVKITFN